MHLQENNFIFNLCTYSQYVQPVIQTGTTSNEQESHLTHLLDPQSLFLFTESVPSEFDRISMLIEFY